MLKIIMKLLPSDSGEISKTGKISVVFQENRLIDKIGVIHNIILVLEDTSKENEKEYEHC